MEPLADRFLEQLRAGSADPGLLALAGDEDPARSASVFEAAARHPDLAPDLERWVPELLVGARPGHGARLLLELAEQVRADAARLDSGGLRSLSRILAGSNFLGRGLRRRPEWIRELAGPLPGPPEDQEPEDWEDLRDAKYRGLLRVAARDFGGRPFQEGLAELSALADRCLLTALRCASAEVGVPPPALFALGKLGGRELNLSSDVDLLFLYEASGPEQDVARNREVAQVARRLKQGLEVPTAEGFGYRVDLDLRPEGRTGALANSVAAALDYYEAFGAEWERQMLIRLRFVAGDAAAGQAFSQAILPFVYRRSVDPGALEHVRAMKTRIEEERRAQRLDLEHHLKEGPGGIRDVEFLLQALQLFYGGVHPELRSGNVLEGLEALGRLGILSEETALALAGAYQWLRRAEHGLQLEEERQLHTVPREPAAQRALARRMGYREPEAEQARERMLDDWTAVRAEVRGHFEELLLGGER
ncbi:MAG: hypothetical protein ABFS46_03480 [Myxococcota bacterium]